MTVSHGRAMWGLDCLQDRSAMLRTLLALTPSRGGDIVFEASLVPQKVEKGLKGPPKPHKPTEAGPRAAGRIPVAVGMQDSRVATTWALRPSN